MRLTSQIQSLSMSSVGPTLDDGNLLSLLDVFDFPFKLIVVNYGAYRRSFSHKLSGLPYLPYVCPDPT